MKRSPSRPSPGGYGKRKKRPARRVKGSWTRDMDRRTHVMIEDSLERMFGK